MKNENIMKLASSKKNKQHWMDYAVNDSEVCGIECAQPGMIHKSMREGSVLLHTHLNGKLDVDIQSLRSCSMLHSL